MLEQIKQNLSRFLLWLLIAISVVLLALFFFGGYVEGTKGSLMEEPLITNKILLWAFILVVIALIMALIFPVVFMILNPKNAVRTLIILGIGVVLVFISYQLASGEVLQLTGYNGPDNIPSVLKKADTGLILTYVLAIIALGGILYTEIAKLFK